MLRKPTIAAIKGMGPQGPSPIVTSREPEGTASWQGTYHVLRSCLLNSFVPTPKGETLRTFSKVPTVPSSPRGETGLAIRISGFCSALFDIVNVQKLGASLLPTVALSLRGSASA